MSDVAERVKKIVVEHLGVEETTVNESADLYDLGADSLVVVELQMAFEEEFNLYIPDNAADQFQTIGDVVRYLEKRTKAT